MSGELDVNKVNPDGKAVNSKEKSVVAKEPDPIEVFPNEDDSDTALLPKIGNSAVTIWDATPKQAVTQDGSILFMSSEKRAQVAAENTPTKADATSEGHADDIDFSQLAGNKEAFLDHTGGTLDEKIDNYYPDATPEQKKEMKELIMLGNNMEEGDKVPSTLRLSRVMPTSTGNVYAKGMIAADKAAQDKAAQDKTIDTCITDSEGKEITPQDKADFAKSADNKEAFLDHTGGTLDEKIDNYYPDATPEQKKEMKELIMLGNNMEEGDKVSSTLRLSRVMPTSTGNVYAKSMTEEGEKAQYDDYKQHEMHHVYLKPGDTMWKLTKDMYKTVNGDLMKTVLDFNGIKDASKAQPGLYQFPGKVATKKGLFYANVGKADNVQNSEDFKNVISDIVEQKNEAKCIDKSWDTSADAIAGNFEPQKTSPEPAEQNPSVDLSQHVEDLKVTPQEVAQNAADDATKLPPNKPKDAQIDF